MNEKLFMALAIACISMWILVGVSRIISDIEGIKSQRRYREHLDKVDEDEDDEDETEAWKKG